MSITLAKITFGNERSALCADHLAPLRWNSAAQWWACDVVTDPDECGCGPLAPVDVYLEHDEAWRHGPRGTLVVGTVLDLDAREG